MKKFKSGNKLLTIVCLCSVACAFTLVSVNTVRNTKLKNESIKANERISAKYELEKSAEKINQNDEKTPVFSQTQIKKEENTAQVNNEQKIPEVSLPVKDGKIIKEFTDTVLVFNEMYGDYRTHNGTDIASNLNSPVMAVKKGIVIKNEFDYEEGFIVEIEHDDGVVSVYKNLDSDKIVKTGQVVNAGDTIGTVGDSAIFEKNMPPHLHFEIREENVEINPADYIKLTD